MKSRSKAVAATVATCAVVAGAPTTAGAAPTVSKLRVGAAGPARALDTGTSYVNDTTLLTTRAGACGGSGKSRRVPEPSSDPHRELRACDQIPPLRRYLASDQYSFGLIVCRIGDFGAWRLD